MRSELINEIFSVESEAERVIQEAQEQGRNRVIEAQREGEQRLKEAVQKARADKEAAIASAQQESDRRIASVHSALKQAESDDQEYIDCADQIAQRMVAILCRSSLEDFLP